jgi:hypothetical protein
VNDMQGGVNYNGNTLLTGGINVNTTGNIQALNVQVTENGERTITPPEGVDGYAPITIDTNVPIPEPVLDTLNVTSNGTYTPPSGVDGYDEVNVSVPTPEPVLDTLNVTSNGIYTPPSGVDGYDEVNVSVSGYTIKTLSTTPTPIASFTDGTDNPLKSLTASIVPVQEGSGEPSPTNVRPISGWTAEVVTRTGGNMLNKSTNVLRQAINANGQTVGLGNGNYTQLIRVNAGDTYTFSAISGVPSWTRRVHGYNNGVWVQQLGYSDDSIGEGDAYTVQVTIPNGITEIRVSYCMADSVAMFNAGNALPYEEYTSTTTTIPFTDGQGQSVEVFGGSVDVVNGVVTPCPYYASYNGEQLTGEWISDRDVYAEGTTPTIGAQVVNIGATGTPFNTQPTSIKSLDGVNNVSASTGQIEELEYFADL